MPAFLLHATASDLLAQRGSLPARFADAFARAPGARRFGSVFLDLPYFSAFPLQIARHFLGTLKLSDPWGHIFHTRGTGRLALAMIEGTRRAHLDVNGSAPAAVALLGGYLSHHAMDRLIHPIVQRHVREALGSRGGRADSHHTEAEKYQSLFFHHALLGHDIMGSDYPREMTASFPGASPWSPKLDQTLLALLRGAVLEVHASAPSERLFRAWLRWTSWYGRLLSGAQGWREGIQALGDPGAVRRRYYEDTGLGEEVDRALALSRDYLRAADETLAGEVIDRAARARFLDAVPDVDLDVGA